MKHSTKRTARLAQIERAAEIEDAAKTDEETSVQALTSSLLRVAKKAEAMRDLSVARGALMDVAKLNGRIIDRVDNTNMIYAVSSEPPMTAEEWEAKHCVSDEPKH